MKTSEHLEKMLSLLGADRDTTSNLTGSWRYFRPVFVEKRPVCEAACPAGNPIRDYLYHAAKGDTIEALRAIKAENPLPSVCGRVCHHPCAKECARTAVDEPLAPFLIERYVADAEETPGSSIPEPMPASGKKVAVVGSGPAGLACAYHCALLGHEVTIFESREEAGGVLRTGIPGYRLPREALDRDLAFISKLRVKLILNHTINSPEGLSSFDAACLCVGASKSRPMDIPATARGVWHGLKFLDEVNAGNRPDIGKKVVIIGGGNTAMDCARAALRLGASATVAYRRSREDMPAIPAEISEAEEEGASFEFHVVPAGIIAEEGKLTAVKFIRTAPGEPGPDGRRLPQPVPGSEFSIEADALIGAVGENPSTDWLNALLLDGNSITADPATMHNLCKDPGVAKGLFSAGDCSSGAKRTVSNAIGAGKRAALSIDIYFKNDFARAPEILSAVAVGPGGTLSAAAYRAGYSGAPVAIAQPTEAAPAHISHEPAQRPVLKPVAERPKNFDEVNPGLTHEQAAAEAARCMGCGTCADCGVCTLFCPDISVVDFGAGKPEFNFDFCKGCGICARECPRSALDMTEEEK